MSLPLAVEVVDHWGGGHMGGGWMWIGATVGLAVLVALVVLAVVLVVRFTGTASSSQDSGQRARNIVMERYARGEISAAEFDELSARLR